MAFASAAVWLHLQKFWIISMEPNVLMAVERRFGCSDDAKLALDQHFGRPDSAKLALEWRFGCPGSAKLALDRRFGRPDGTKLALERRFGRPWTPSGPWNDVLGRLGSRCNLGCSENSDGNIV